MRLPRPSTLLALAAVLVLSARADAQSLYPGALDSSANLPAVATGEVIQPGESNTQSDALFKIERAIGADSTLATQSILQRLALKANTSSLDTLNPKVLASTLNAGAYAGTDIGAKVNAAIADCDAKLGSSLAFCRITTPPGIYVQTTAIKIGRARTLLDCQQAFLVPSNAFTDIPIRLNYPTAGSQASATSDIGVRNCIIDDSLQASMSSIVGTDTGDNGNPRMGMVVAWKISNLDLQNLDVRNSFGPGVSILQSQGFVSRVAVTNTRSPFAGGNAAGLYVSGTGYGMGLDGQPVYVNGVRVDTSATYGVWAVVGAVLRDVDVRATQSACVAIGGAEIQGWITLDSYTLSDCALGAATATGAVDDLEAAGHDLVTVAIRNGVVRRSRSDGIRFTASATMNHVDIDNNSIECFGTDLAGSGIVVSQDAGPSYAIRVRNNYVSHDTVICGAQVPVAFGIHVAGALDQVIVEGNSLVGSSVDDPGHGLRLSATVGLSRVYARDNFIIGHSTPIYVAVDSGAYLLNSELTDNVLWGCPSAICGLITIVSPSGADIEHMRIQGNSGMLPADVYGVRAIVDAASTFRNVWLTGNYFTAYDNGYREVLNSGTLAAPFIYGTSVVQEVASEVGVVASQDLTSILRKNTDGALVPINAVVCVKSDGTFQKCGTATTAKNAIGVALGDIDNNAFGPIAVTGVLPQVGCTGTVAAGDLLVRSSATAGSLMTSGSPGAGEVVGKALSTCSGGFATVLLGR